MRRRSLSLPPPRARHGAARARPLLPPRVGRKRPPEGADEHRSFQAAPQHRELPVGEKQGGKVEDGPVLPAPHEQAHAVVNRGIFCVRTVFFWITVFRKFGRWSLREFWLFAAFFCKIVCGTNGCLIRLYIILILNFFMF